MRPRPHPAALAAVGALAVAVLPGTGCVAHLRRNAPGHVDPAAPARTRFGEVEVPRDPGERLVVGTFGALGGAGVGLGDAWDGAGTAVETSIELGAHFGELSSSHFKPDLIPIVHVFPDWTHGVNAGVSLLDPRGESGGAARLYVEYERARHLLYGWSAGYGIDPIDGRHGPQVTLFFAALYGRATYQTGEGFTAIFGLVFKPPVATFIWSR